MRRLSITAALLLTSVALAALPGTASAASGAWSPRSSAYPTQALWTRAGLVRVPHAAGEISTARVAKPRREKPPVATAATTWSTRIASLQAPERGPQSSLRVAPAHAGVARLRTSALPDSGARSANLALLAGVFHEAHAPPFSLDSCLI